VYFERVDIDFLCSSISCVCVRERVGECVSVCVWEREKVCFERFDLDIHCSGTSCV